MTRRLLVPLTDSKHSWPGLEHALSVFPDADITVINVVDPTGAGYGDRSAEEGHTDPRVEELFAAAEELAAEYDVSLDTAFAEGRPADVIVEYANGNDIDGIIMGSRGRSGVSRVLLGSVAGTVVQYSSVPVTVVP